MKIKGGRKTHKYLIYISCLCLLLATGAMTAISLMGVQSVRESVWNTMTKSIMGLTVSKVQFLDEKIHSELLPLQPLAANLGVFDNLFAYSGSLEDYKEKRGATRIWIINTNRTYQDTGGVNRSFAGKKELFTEALQGNEGITGVFLGKLERRQVMFQTPVCRDGKVVDGFYETYPVELLQNAYHGSTYNDTGYNYVLDSNDSIVLALVYFNCLQIYSTIQDVSEDGEDDRKSIREFSVALRSQASGTTVSNLEGEEQSLTFMPFMQKHSWYYVSVTPLGMVEKDGTVIVMYTMKMVFIITAAIVFSVAIITAFFLLRNKKGRDYERCV